MIASDDWHHKSSAPPIACFEAPWEHMAQVYPVFKSDGPQAGRWMCKIVGPKVKGVSGVKTVYSGPSWEEAQAAIAEFIGAPQKQVRKVRALKSKFEPWQHPQSNEAALRLAVMHTKVGAEIAEKLVEKLTKGSKLPSKQLLEASKALNAAKTAIEFAVQSLEAFDAGSQKAAS